MKCEQVQQLIPDWLEGEAEAFQAEAIEKHMDKCAACRDELSFWQAVGTSLREESESIKAPPDFAAGVMAQIPVQRNTGVKNPAARWKRSVAAAAAFLLVTAGSAGAYVQWGLNTAPRVAQNENLPGLVTEHDPGQNDPGTSVPDPGSRGSKDSEKEPGKTDPGKDSREPAGNDQEPGTANSGGEKPGSEKDNSGGIKPSGTGNEKDPAQYVWLNAGSERVIERTFLRLSVNDFSAARRQAVEYLDNSGARYEILGTEITASGTQETLKIVVDSDMTDVLVGNLKNLGQVKNNESQRDEITARYKEYVEQYRTLESQLAATQDSIEREQLQVKMANIEAQLKAWDKEARTDTVILQLES